MAFVGMRHVVAAKLASHTPGSAPTYSAGMVVGKAITGNLTITRNSNPLYADDVVAEDDNSITAMSLELGLDDILEDVQAYMGLLEEVTTGTGTTAVTHYLENSAPSDEVGVGYIRVRRKNGATTYQVVWIYKTLFSIGDENSQTKGESIEWQTPTAQGNAMAIDVGGTSGPSFRLKRNFDTEDAAIEYLDGLAGIE